MNARRADIEDWSPVLSLWRELKSDPHHSFRIEGDDDLLKAYFKGSLSSEMLQFWVVEDLGQIVGFALTQIILTPFPSKNGMVSMLPSMFIRAVYTRDRGNYGGAAMLLQQVTEECARQNKCVTMFGNCRMDFPHKAAFKKYGYEATHICVRKEL